MTASDTVLSVAAYFSARMNSVGSMASSAMSWVLACLAIASRDFPAKSRYAIKSGRKALKSCR